jgi:aminopeptidase YwaD
MKRTALTALLLLLATSSMALAERKVTLMTDDALEAIRATVSGATAKSHVRELSQMHRVQATAGYHQAAEMMQELAVSYGLKDVRIEKLAADGETLYHHFRAYYGWRPVSGRLWEVSPGNERLGDFSESKVALADYSQDAHVTAALVDVGKGTRPEDYEGKDVRGKVVLAGGDLPTVHRLAVEERGAVGMLSYYPNQRTGWSGDDPDLVRWGHLDPANTGNKFAFMTSPRQARALQGRLAAGEAIVLKAEVEARLVPDYFEVVTALIPGTDRADEEIVFSCHLDHQSPGANDNASGAATILEVARTLSLLVGNGTLPPPRRTLRFVWPPEISGSFAYLDRHPEIVSRMKAGIHMDMVGGIPQTTKSMFFLSRPPTSIPSFIGDVGEVFFDYVAAGSRHAASEGDFREAIVSPEGTKEDFAGEIQGLDLGSDHQVYGDSTFRVPMLYFHDWPDVYIHTNKDVPENLDATKLQRVAFLGAAIGYTLASLGPDDGAALLAEAAGRGAERMGADRTRALALVTESEPSGLESAYREALNVIDRGLEREKAALDSIVRFTGTGASLAPWVESLESIHGGDRIAARAAYDASCRAHGVVAVTGDPAPPATPRGARIPERTEAVPGPTNVYYYDLLEDKLGHGSADAISLSETAQFEALNFVDGTRTVQAIRDAVSAELGPVAIEAVETYLEVLAKAGAVRFK